MVVSASLPEDAGTEEHGHNQQDDQDDQQHVPVGAEPLQQPEARDVISSDIDTDVICTDTDTDLISTDTDIDTDLISSDTADLISSDTHNGTVVPRRIVGCTGRQILIPSVSSMTH